MKVCGYGFHEMPRVILAFLLAVAVLPAQVSLVPEQLDKIAAKWVEDTFKKMTLDDKVGQLVVTAISSTYLATDSDEFDAARKENQRSAPRRLHRLRRRRAGARRSAQQHLRHGDSRPAARGRVADESPAESLDASAAEHRRLRSRPRLPHPGRDDVSARDGRRRRRRRAARVRCRRDITALEARAIGVHLNFSPVADVNNNPRNPVINTRSFGEIPDGRRPLAPTLRSAACTPAACWRR